MVYNVIFRGILQLVVAWLIGTQYVAVINFQVNMQDRFGQVMIQNLRVDMNYDFEFVGHVAAIRAWSHYF